MTMNKRMIIPTPPTRRFVQKPEEKKRISSATFIKTHSEKDIINRMQKDIEQLQSKFVKLINESVKTREALDEFEKWKRESFEDLNFSDFEKLHGRLENIDRKTKEKSEGHDKEIEGIKANIDIWNKKLDEMRNIENEMKKLNIKHISREIEKLKTKVEWIENNIEKIDIEPIFERINELESKIRVLKLSSPIIIE